MVKKTEMAIYDIAMVISIPTLGDHILKGTAAHGQDNTIVAQVCKVNKASLSVLNAIQAGNSPVIDPEGSYIESETPGGPNMVNRGGWRVRVEGLGEG